MEPGEPAVPGLKRRRNHLIPVSIREAENFKFPRFFRLTVTTKRKWQGQYLVVFSPPPFRVRVAVHSPSIPLHAAPVLTTNRVKRAADLAEPAVANGVHLYRENVAVVDGRLFEFFKYGRPATMVFFQ
jgi:hypothetical protein